MPNSVNYRNIWIGGQGASPPAEYPGWPQSGVAFVGDFSGIQSFVLRPVPGARGAAKRLRSRSFQVSAYTELVARWCVQQLSDCQPRMLYSAGGRFLVGAGPLIGWPAKVREMQRAIDDWTWENFQGELVFHLVAAEFTSGRIPCAQLHTELETRRGQPLADVIRSKAKWVSSLFFHPAEPGEGRCQACGVTRTVKANPDG